MVLKRLVHRVLDLAASAAPNGPPSADTKPDAADLTFDMAGARPALSAAVNPRTGVAAPMKALLMFRNVAELFEVAVISRENADKC